MATKHMRRGSLRLLFRIARLEFDWHYDPTLELKLPARTGEAGRPLTNEEVVLGRSYSLHTLTVTRQPAAWALTEASAITSELQYITSDDLDLDNPNGPRVWLHGSRKRVDRWGLLDDWSATQLERRATSLKGAKGLVYTANGSEESRQASYCKALQDVFIRCDLDAEPDVRPSSLVAWAGVVALEETDKIEEVALRLGIRSLDVAARFIGFNWNK